MRIDVPTDFMQPHLNNILNYQFTLSNPLFWVILFIFCLLLLRFWDLKKSFSFGFVLAIVLLATTKIESIAASKLTGAGEAYDPVVVRVLSVLAVCLIVLYYVFIKTDSAY